ncbi:MAG TPA: TylF/MycF family methyltransferase [Bryobacteraceae bacterium]|nr:TylF/MycF family methyltransferase [Bryobacteraceae bacterium]
MSAATAGRIATQSELAQARSLYLDLLRRSLVNIIYPEADASMAMGSTPAEWVRKKLAALFGCRLVRPLDPACRQDGRDWPLFAHSMIGMARLSNLQSCVESVIRDNVPGDVIETGVWRGGACVLMRGVLKAYGATDRRVWVADSFAGLPRPTEEADKRDPAGKLHSCSELAVSLEQVKTTFSRYGLLDEQVVFLKGWFSETLPNAPIERLAVARLDGDMYESTLDALRALYPKLCVGGYLIIDDYSDISACRQAVEDYRGCHGITEPIIPIDWSGVYWRRQR